MGWTGQTWPMTQMRGREAQPGDPTLGALFVDASRDLSTLLRSEIALAKAEIRRDAKRGAVGGAMFGAAGFFATLGVILLAIAVALLLVKLGVVAWVAFGIVGLAAVLFAGLLGLVGKKLLGKVGPPERTIRTSKDTAAFLKSPRGNGASRG